MDWIDYREKLGIGFSDKEKVKMLITNLLTFINLDMKRVSFEDYIGIVFEIGCAVPEATNLNGDSLYDISRADHLWDILINHQESLEDFLSYYLILMNSWSNSDRKRDYRTVLTKMLRRMHIEYELIEDEKGCFIFPKGAKELDGALVSQPLDWLSAYPKAHNAFSKALRKYADADQDNASEVADLFRKALETFFREFFGKTQSLENLKSEYGKYMKAQGIPAEISNNLETLHQSYTNFMNGYAKHHDKTSKNVLEYIIYQTGNIIRLLITLRAEETNDAN